MFRENKLTHCTNNFGVNTVELISGTVKGHKSVKHSYGNPIFMLNYHSLSGHAVINQLGFMRGETLLYP